MKNLYLQFYDDDTQRMHFCCLKEHSQEHVQLINAESSKADDKKAWVAQTFSMGLVSRDKANVAWRARKDRGFELMETEAGEKHLQEILRKHGMMTNWRPVTIEPIPMMADSFLADDDGIARSLEAILTKEKAMLSRPDLDISSIRITTEHKLNELKMKELQKSIESVDDNMINKLYASLPVKNIPSITGEERDTFAEADAFKEKWLASQVDANGLRSTFRSTFDREIADKVLADMGEPGFWDKGTSTATTGVETKPVNIEDIQKAAEMIRESEELNMIDVVEEALDNVVGDVDKASLREFIKSSLKL